MGGEVFEAPEQNIQKLIGEVDFADVKFKFLERKIVPDEHSVICEGVGPVDNPFEMVAWEFDGKFL